MSIPQSRTPAEKLVDLLREHNNSIPSDQDVQTVILEVQRDIVELDEKFNKKTHDKLHLSRQVFRKNVLLKNDNEALNYFRDNLKIARQEFDLLTEQLKSDDGTLTFADVKPYSRIIIDFLFDVSEIATWLQRKVRGWRFISGHRTSNVTSWEVFMFARDLSRISRYVGTGSPLDHRMSQIASIMLLRQAMELRFQRLVAVYMENEKGAEPRLKHDFYYDFITSNQQYFEQNNVAIAELWHLYEWCSEIVHKAYHPYGWLILLAVRRAGDLLHTQKAAPNQAWSLFNSVEIKDVEVMQQAFEDHFLSTYEHGKWKFSRTRPEALFKGGWTDDMAKQSSAFISVKNPKS